MSTIRRQSILSSGIVYFGFALGAFNTWLFTRQGGFTQTEYGLTGIFVSIANIMFSFANLGMQAFINKFYPYYDDNLPKKQNDLMTWALGLGCVGFGLVLLSGFIFKSLVIRKFGAHSSELLRYYYWTFPFGFGLTIYSILEAYAWQLKKSVFTNYLKEFQFRLFTTILIVLFLSGVFRSFDPFIEFYSLGFIIIAGTLLVYLLVKKQIDFTFSVSRVTRKFRKKIMTLAAFIWGGALLHNIAPVFAPLVLASIMTKGLADTAPFILAQYMTSIMQAPQRGIVAASLGPLSKAWKDKDFKKINLIYHRSSINQLIFSAAIFLLIWLNFTDGIMTFQLQHNYLEAKYVFFFLGLNCVIDMGTGVNGQIIGTSTLWRFDFFTGIILMGISIPLTYLLAKSTGIIGPAIATLISFTVYNTIRFIFLWKKFGMQPFDKRTILALVVALADYAICAWLFGAGQGLGWLFARSTTFIAIYLALIIYLKLSPDLVPVWQTIKKRAGIG